MLTRCKSSGYIAQVIRSFRNKALADLWSTGRTAKIDLPLHKRILLRLSTIDKAAQPEALDIVGFDFHALRRFRPTRYTVHVNGPWCITFEFDGGDAYRVDLEQYH
jgi:proteic killer suppression protein